MSQSFKSFDEADISSIELWLCDTVKLPEYYSNFAEHGYESMEFVREITQKSELQEIGIKLPGHLKLIMAKIKQLKKERLSITDSDENMDIELQGVNKKDTIGLLDEFVMGPSSFAVSDNGDNPLTVTSGETNHNGCK